MPGAGRTGPRPVVPTDGFLLPHVSYGVGTGKKQDGFPGFFAPENHRKPQATENRLSGRPAGPGAAFTVRGGFVTKSADHNPENDGGAHGQCP
jgi:hypothetical protein